MKLTAILSLVLLAATLTSCNTFEGLGNDISRGGDAISDAAVEARESQQHRDEQAELEEQRRQQY